MATKHPKPRLKPKRKTNAEWETERLLRERLEMVRWPHGFVCPRCGWRHTWAWAQDKAKRIRERFKGVQSDANLRSLKRTWYLANGNIKCQQCKRHISLTTGTVLEGTHLKFATIFKAAGYFIQPRDGISAMELASKAGISTRGARNLIKRFHKAMTYTSEDMLEGDIQIDETELVLRPAKAKRNIFVKIAVAAESKEGIPHRIALNVLPSSTDYPCLEYVDMVKKQSTVVLRIHLDHIDEFWFMGFKVKPGAVQGADTLLPLCASVYEWITNIIGNRYRGAINRDNLQGYLCEISFRWNSVPRDPNGDTKPAIDKLMVRLLSPPCAKPSHEDLLAKYESWMARS